MNTGKAHQQSNATGAPKVTIVTVAFNAEATIEQTMLSVFNLAYENIEYIVIDGGSTYNTLNIIKKYKAKIHLWISEPDRGIYDGMNKGIQAATGDWINFMNCGDRFASAQALDFFYRTAPGKDILYGDAVVEYPTFQAPFAKHPLSAMWKVMPFCHQATFASAALMKAFKFDLKYKLSADLDFLYKAYRAGKQFEYVNQVICFFDYTGGASKKSMLRSVRERQAIALSQNFNALKWLYYQALKISIYLREAIKKILGTKITAWVTESLRT